MSRPKIRPRLLPPSELAAFRRVTDEYAGHWAEAPQLSVELGAAVRALLGHIEALSREPAPPRRR